MKKLHVFGAIFGSVCAMSFAMLPFMASADSGPAKRVAPVSHAKAVAPATRVKMRVERGNVPRQDDGCSD